MIGLVNCTTCNERKSCVYINPLCIFARQLENAVACREQMKKVFFVSFRTTTAITTFSQLA